MDPVIPASARKHVVADDGMLHAYRNPIRVFDFDEFTMLIGQTLPVGCLTSAPPLPRGSSSSSMPCQPGRSS